MTEKELQRQYKTISLLVSALANVCAAAPNAVIDNLTGFLWDEEEAVRIKQVAVSETEQLEERNG